MIFHKREELDSPFAHIFVASGLSEHGQLSSKTTNYVAPLYVYEENSSIVASRQQKSGDFRHVLTSNTLTESSLLSNKTSEISSQFPLYLEPRANKRPNFDIPMVQELFSDVEQPNESSREVYPEDILDYIYASLHSPSYRKKYNEFLKTNFPRVPRPASWADFWRIAELGEQLRKLHLMKSSILDDSSTTFPELGDLEVEKVEYKDEKVWINNTQYFGNVPETAWNFWIGGYQPAQKWLKDRKGRKLSDEDIEHYQKIIKILVETDRIMKEIDK